MLVGGGFVRVEHIAQRPNWICGACGDQWPCEEAKENFRRDGLEGTCLRMYLWSQLQDATTDLSGVPAEQLFERFFSWAVRS